MPDYNQIFKGFEGFSPLHLAIKSNDFECVRLLIDETNIDILQCSDFEETPIHIACKTGVII